MVSDHNSSSFFFTRGLETLHVLTLHVLISGKGHPDFWGILLKNTRQ